VSTARRTRVISRAASCALGGSLLATEPAAAAPSLEASIDWLGECRDDAALRAEVQARGADLADEVTASATKLRVSARQARSGRLVADISLVTPGSSEQRQVEARECIGLRQAVAWVLVILAEERETAERARAPSAGAFPPSPTPSLPASPAPPGARPPRKATRPVPSNQPAPAQPCAGSGPRWQLGSELSVGFGLVDAVALGPSLAVGYRPCARWLPGISLGGSRLVSMGYELDSRPISIERTSAQAGAWTTLGVPVLRVGMVLEAGRIRATGIPSARGPGATSLAPWFACVVPVRLSVPLLARALAASTGVDAVYTPLSYSLRYASGAQLARARHFELRGAVGLSGSF
jgi:hypothetical protein